MIQPHGGNLVNRIVEGKAREALLEAVPSMPRIRLNPRELADFEMIATGAMSPLEGFLRRADYEGVVDRMRLENGTLFPLPVVLATKPGDDPSRISPGMDVALEDAGGEVLGVLHVQDVWEPNKEHEAQATLQTTDEAHPGVQYLKSIGTHYLGGTLSALRKPAHEQFAEYRRDPADTRRLFEERGWTTVAAFQTRNPIHRAHEYLTKVALEQTDGVLIHPLVGDTKADDVPSAVRMQCYQVLLERYYPADRTVLSVYPQAMRYAGPREAILHSICRQNYGCSHIIIGRDHAGVGTYYGTFDAQKIFDTLEPGDLAIQQLRFEHAFWCKRTGGMATTKSSPAGPEERVFLSGTKVRAMLAEGTCPPPEFTRPEVAAILLEHYRGKGGAAPAASAARAKA